MSRILMVAQANAPVIGGVESHVGGLLRGLTERGDSVLLLCGRGNATATKTNGGVIASSAIGGADLFSHRSLDRTALKALIWHSCRAFRPDVVHIHNPNHFDPALVDVVLAARGPWRLVGSVHDRPAEPSANNVLVRPWDHVMFASQYLRDALPRPPVSSVVHLGIDTAVFRPDVGMHPSLDSLSRPVIFHPARLLAWKGILDSAKAFIEVRRKLGCGSLLLTASESILAEPGAVHAVRTQVVRRFEEANMVDALVFRDFSHAEMPAAYATADLVWYPTRDEEPFGLVPLEAMACGRVVVTTSSGGMRETIADGRGASVIAPGDVTALVENTLALLQNPAYLKSMELEAIRQVAPRSLVAYLDHLQHVYRGGA